MSGSSLQDDLPGTDTENALNGRKLQRRELHQSILLRTVRRLPSFAGM
jgi:hypothetical protein